jgi:methylase of polypeptide subunit release factors
MGAKLPKAFDWILINPPWLAASRLDGESAIGEGVYD